MPNIASILKEEIVRLARKETRQELEGLRKASAQYRSDIAALKRRMTSLESQVTRLGKREPGRTESAPADEGTLRPRFSAKGLASQRQRLGLSAADMGILLGVSAQTIYNWEAGKSKPRSSQLAAIAALRGTGKRNAKARLEALAGS
jgi:DNA-binding transcriptional regulator YiaG